MLMGARPYRGGYPPRVPTSEGYPPFLNRPYIWSEVIHRAGDESFFPAFERERPRIVNNFAASASSGYECSSSSEEDESDETFEPGDEA